MAGCIKITSEDVASWQQELAELDRQISVASDKAAKIRRKLAAVAKLEEHWDGTHTMSADADQPNSIGTM